MVISLDIVHAHTEFTHNAAALIRKIVDDSEARLSTGCETISSPATVDSSSLEKSTSTPKELSLYSGEALETIAGFPTIYYFRPTEKPRSIRAPKPLIVCVPGAAHLGRIFYGGHKGSDPKDFLAYQLNQLGFDVLSLSYPLDIGNLMPKTAAGFRIPDWGRQAAMTTKKVIEDNGLPTKSIVLLGWSMAGRMPVPFNITAKELGLEVQQFISLCATPGMSGIRGPASHLPCSSEGYFSLPSRLEGFYQQVEEMQVMNQGKEIIPRNIYMQEYTGGMPINLSGYGLRYDGKGAFAKDEVIHEEETKVFDTENQTLVAALYPTSIHDAMHALTDRANWGLILTLKLESMTKKSLAGISGTSGWPELINMVHSAPNRLFLPVPGNHFFFIGERSARGAAEAVNKLIDEVTQLQKELARFT